MVLLRHRHIIKLWSKIFVLCVLVIVGLYYFVPLKIRYYVWCLRTENRRLAMGAYEALINLGNRPVPLLISALGDESRRESALSCLQYIGPPAVPSLIKALEDEDPIVRSSAAFALLEIKDERAIFPLINTLNDNDKRVRASAAAALGFMGQRRAVKTLLTLLKDEDLSNNLYPFRTFVKLGLGRTRCNKTVETLINEFNDKSNAISFRTNILNILGDTQDERALQILFSALKSEEGLIRVEAARSLGGIAYSFDPDEIVPGLLDVLNSKEVNEDTQVSVIRLLGKFGDKSAVPDILKVMTDGDKLIRYNAAYAAAQIGERSVIPVLIEALEQKFLQLTWLSSSALEDRVVSGRYDTKPGIVWAQAPHEAVNNLLKKMTGQNFELKQNTPKEEREKVITKWRDWWEKNKDTFPNRDANN